MREFEKVAIKKPAVNVFNLSHDVKATYNFDKLYPFLCHPVYPGDTFNCRAEVFLRTMPLKAPVMHNCDMHLYFFFVPNRLLWNENRKDDWKVFITGGEDGKAASYDENGAPVFPHWNYSQLTILTQKYGPKSLLDYMGFPTVNTLDGNGATNRVSSDRTEPISSLPFRAYQLIWNEYFRNQNVQNEIEFSYDSGLETSTDLSRLMTFRSKCWEKDYFTSCLPWTQRGEAVTLPIESTFSVGDGTLLTGSAELAAWKDDGASGSGQQLLRDAQGLIGVSTASSTPKTGSIVGPISVSSGTLAFSGVAIGTINDFRYCLRLQQWLENNARCGSRYIEQLLSHFGVVSSDARLQRPELLGGGKVPLLFSDVEQTSESTNSSVQGNLAGKGMLYGKTHGFKKYFEEHGILMGICCIIPRTSYSQGIPRYWTLFDKTDWYFPEFSHLGEQAVLNKELFYCPNWSDSDYHSNVQDEAIIDSMPDSPFGYIGRFDELRYIPSSVHGELRGNLSYWHFGRLFGEDPQQNFVPALNYSFVEAQTRANVWAIEDIANGVDDPFICQMHLDIKATRPMPKFAVPTL